MALRVTGFPADVEALLEKYAGAGLSQAAEDNILAQSYLLQVNTTNSTIIFTGSNEDEINQLIIAYYMQLLRKTKTPWLAAIDEAIIAEAERQHEDFEHRSSGSNRILAGVHARLKPQFSKRKMPTRSSIVRHVDALKAPGRL